MQRCKLLEKVLSAALFFGTLIPFFEHAAAFHKLTQGISSYLVSHSRIHFTNKHDCINMRVIS